MKIAFRNLKHIGAVGLLIAAVGLAGCKSSSGERTSGQKENDHEVAKSVKSKLEHDPTFKYPDVHVAVYEGNVQLTGFADYPEQRLRAADLAAQAKGARQVINQIMIKTTPTGPATIRDPLGHETGRLMLNTNAPVPQMRNLPQSQQPAPGEQTAPKQ